jgi:hypothetical protein
VKRPLAILVLVSCALAQEPRDAYQEALGMRSDKMSAEAAKYTAGRKAFLDFLREATQAKARSLEPLLIAAQSKPGQ